MWVVVAFVFGGAGVVKWSGGGVAGYLLSTGMFPGWTGPVVASLLVPAECLTAASLLWSRTRRAGWVLAAGLSSGFVAFHVLALLLGEVQPCRCLGFSVPGAGVWNHIAMGVICVLLVFAAFVSVRRAPRAIGATGVREGCAV